MKEDSKTKIKACCPTCGETISKPNISCHIKVKHPWLPINRRGRPNNHVQLLSAAATAGPAAAITSKLNLCASPGESVCSCPEKSTANGRPAVAVNCCPGVYKSANLSVLQSHSYCKRSHLFYRTSFQQQLIAL